MQFCSYLGSPLGVSRYKQRFSILSRKCAQHVRKQSVVYRSSLHIESHEFLSVCRFKTQPYLAPSSGISIVWRADSWRRRQIAKSWCHNFIFPIDHGYIRQNEMLIDVGFKKYNIVLIFHSAVLVYL